MLIRHSAVYVAARLLPGAVGMTTTALLTRLLEPAAYGAFGVALVTATLGASLLFDWLGLAYLRLPGAGPAIACLFALGASLAAALAALLWTCGLLGDAVAAGLLLMVCTAGFELAARRPVATGQPGRFLLMNATRTLLSLLGATSAAVLTHDPVPCIAGFALGPAMGALLGGAGPSLRWHAPTVRTVLAFGLPLAGSLALAAAANSGARALLGALCGPEALGQYTAAFLLVQNTIAVVAAGIGAAGYPAAVRLLEAGRRDAAARQMLANGALLLGTLVPLAAAMALTSGPLAAVLVGPGYVAAVARLTPWLAAAGLFAGLRSQGVDPLFQLAGRPGRLMLVTGVMAALALGLTALLSPGLGALGAAVASCLAAAAALLLALVWGQRTWPVPFGWKARRRGKMQSA